MNPIQQAIEACEWVQLVFTDDTMAQERDPELWMPKMGEALTSLRSLQTASGFGMKLIPQASGFSADPEAPAGVQVPQEVLDALFYVDDYIARVNGDDRGSCESVNVLRRFLDSLAADPEAPAQVQPEHELQALEREHLGDFDKRTGIYATQPTQAEAPSERERWEKVRVFAERIVRKLDNAECAKSPVSGYTYDAAETATFILAEARAALATQQAEALSVPDCGEAGHAEGRCGNASCVRPTATQQAVPERLAKSLRDRGFRVPETLDEAIKSVAEIIAEDGLIIAWKDRKLEALQQQAAQGEPALPQGWRFVRRPDGIGIYAPPPRHGENARTGHTVPASNRDLYDLLGKLADQQATPPAPGQVERDGEDGK